MDVPGHPRHEGHQHPQRLGQPDHALLRTMLAVQADDLTTGLRRELNLQSDAVHRPQLLVEGAALRRALLDELLDPLGGRLPVNSRQRTLHLFASLVERILVSVFGIYLEAALDGPGLDAVFRDARAAQERWHEFAGLRRVNRVTANAQRDHADEDQAYQERGSHGVTSSTGRRVRRSAGAPAWPWAAAAVPRG